MSEGWNFSENHRSWMRRDEAFILGWRYEPRVIFKQGRGVKLVDLDGNEYYDLTSGMMSLPLGHAHPELTETIREQAGRFVHESSWYSNPWLIEFAELLVGTLPSREGRVNFAVTGSEANEVALRAACAATGNYDVVSVVRGLHGGTLAAESLTSVGGARRQNLGPLLTPSRLNVILPPFCYRCPIQGEYPECDVACLKLSDELLERTSTRQVAAIIAETVPVAGGMIVPPRQWLPGLRKLADKWGALLILDEAQLAPARTGKLWGFEHYEVVPDILTFAKGMGAGMAITGMIAGPDVAQRAAGKAGLPWAGTFTGDPLAAAVALKQLQIIRRDNLPARAERLGSLLRQGLDRLKDKYEAIGDVRGVGFYQMLDFVSDRETRAPDFEMAERMRLNALREGLVLIAVQNFVRLCPPLVTTESELEDILGRLDAALLRSVRHMS